MKYKRLRIFLPKFFKTMTFLTTEPNLHPVTLLLLRYTTRGPKKTPLQDDSIKKNKDNFSFSTVINMFDKNPTNKYNTPFFYSDRQRRQCLIFQ